MNNPKTATLFIISILSIFPKNNPSKEKRKAGRDVLCYSWIHTADAARVFQLSLLQKYPNKFLLYLNPLSVGYTSNPSYVMLGCF